MYSSSLDFKGTLTWSLIASGRGGSNLEVNGYLHRIDKTRGNKTYYKCIQRTCKGRAVHINDDTETAKITVSHPHPPDTTTLHQRKFREKFHSAIASSPTTLIPGLFKRTRREFANSAIGVDEENPDEDFEAALPLFHNVKSAGYRARAKLLPPLLQARSDLDLFAEYKNIGDREFYLGGSSGNDILIFGTLPFLRILCSAERVFMDGTFKSAPQLWTQLYTLHAFHKGIMVPCIYGILSDKSSDTYAKFFNMVERIATKNHLTFNPEIFQIDFETGTISGVKEKYGHNIQINGCLFHFGQSVWRKVSELGLKQRYSSDIEFKRFVRRLCGLALCPMDNLDNLWIEIMHNAPNDPATVELLSYFVNTFFDEYGALYDRSIWNHNIDHVRTINHLEGWHHALNRSVGKIHPNIYEIILELQKQQQNFELDLRAVSAGARVKPQQKRYRELEDRIKENKAYLQTQAITPLEYLDRIKYVLHLESV